MGEQRRKTRDSVREKPKKERVGGGKKWGRKDERTKKGKEGGGEGC